MRLREHYRCDAAGCTQTRRLVFLIALARTEAGVEDVGLHLCAAHVKLHVNGLHVALRSTIANPYGMLALISRGTPRVGIVDAGGQEVTVDAPGDA